MNNNQFISWLKGFVAAIEEKPTKGQWETIVSELSKIQEYTEEGHRFDVLPYINTSPFKPPYEITCRDNSITLTTSTTYGYPSGSTVTYTLTNDSKDK